MWVDSVISEEDIKTYHEGTLFPLYYKEEILDYDASRGNSLLYQMFI